MSHVFLLGHCRCWPRSNAGLYGLGPKDGRYGRLRLDKVFFGISAAISGSLVSASCLTVNGDLLVTSVSAAPLLNRSQLETFSDSMIGSLTIAAMQKKPLERKGTPLVDNPLDPRGKLPWYYLLETPKLAMIIYGPFWKWWNGETWWNHPDCHHDMPPSEMRKGTLQCPEYEELKSYSMPAFDVDKYVPCQTIHLGWLLGFRFFKTVLFWSYFVHTLRWAFGMSWPSTTLRSAMVAAAHNSTWLDMATLLRTCPYLSWSVFDWLKYVEVSPMSHSEGTIQIITVIQLAWGLQSPAPGHGRRVLMGHGYRDTMWSLARWIKMVTFCTGPIFSPQEGQPAHWQFKMVVSSCDLSRYLRNGNRRMNMHGPQYDWCWDAFSDTLVVFNEGLIARLAHMRWTCNMTMYYKPQKPGVMLETGFGQEFDNMVLEIWSDPEIAAQTGYEYTRSIQFQCLGWVMLGAMVENWCWWLGLTMAGSEKDGITFTGINFLSRVPIVECARQHWKNMFKIWDGPKVGSCSLGFFGGEHLDQRAVGWPTKCYRFF